MSKRKNYPLSRKLSDPRTRCDRASRGGFASTPVLSRLRKVFRLLSSVCKLGKKEYKSVTIERRSFAGLKQVWGFGLIEVVVAATIITVFFVAILSTYSFFLKTLLGGTQDVQATFLLREGAEVARILRDSSWSSNVATATVGTEYYLSWSGSAWVLSATPSYVDGVFDRTVTFESVYRDVNDDIASSGTIDDNIRLVTVDVAWRNSAAATTTKTLQTYLTNLYSN